MHDLASDLRYATRMLWKNPGFTAVAVLALALGIGANTAIFSVVNAVLLRPLPYPSAHRLVDITDMEKGRDTAMSYPDFQDFRLRNHTFTYFAAYRQDTWALTAPNQQAVNLSVAIVSADLFPMLGVQPARGRVFRKAEDEKTSGPLGLVISAKAWRERFGGDPQVVGRVITLRGLPYTVIGVMPRGFNFPVRNEAYDAWTTFGFSDTLKNANGSAGMGTNRGVRYLRAVGQLNPGVALPTADADLNGIASALARQYPNTNRYHTARLESLIDHLVGATRPTLILLLSAVGCVLLVACANVANLLLARASTRRRELAIRAALGAGRLRVIRQVLTESVLLSLVGGAAGLVLGVWGNELLIRFSPENVPRLGESRFDFAVFFFALGVSVATGIVFGIVPALRASQSGPGDALKEGSRGSTEGIRNNKARSMLIVAEIALALTLLASAGLLLKSLDRLSGFPTGFQAERVLTAQINFPPRYSDPQQLVALHQLQSLLNASPDVVSAGGTAVLPLGGDDIETGFQIEGHLVPMSDRPATRVNLISPGYRKTMGIQLLSGRDLLDRDTMDAPPVVLVNAAFARRFFPGQDAVGHAIVPGISTRAEKAAPLRTIVGVIASVDQDRVGQEPLPEVYIPENQLPFGGTTVVVRTRSNPRAFVPALAAALRSVDPDIPLDQVRTMDELVSASLAQPRFQSFLVAVFAAVALFLTALGLYGVIAYSVSQRTREIGTRMALGARQQNILRLVVGQGMLLAVAGVSVGLIGAVLAARLLQSMLFEVVPGDPFILAVVCAVVLGVALLATFLPARRAANVDPMVALRHE